MLTLYVFGPAWGLPDPSPFVVKTMIQLNMAGIAYRPDDTGFPRAPKGKLPFIEDGDKTVADSTLIRDYIEQAYDVDLDRDLTGPQRALSWAIERMLEDHLYWAMVHLRWADEENFAKGPAHFFDGAPAEIRDEARRNGRQDVLQALRAHGLGRHSEAEIATLATRSLRALSEILGDKPYLMGTASSAVDATAAALLGSILTPYFSSPIRDGAAGLSNLFDYRDRVMAKFLPAFQA